MQYGEKNLTMTSSDLVVVLKVSEVSEMTFSVARALIRSSNSSVGTSSEKTVISDWEKGRNNNNVASFLQDA